MKALIILLLPFLINPIFAEIKGGKVIITPEEQKEINSKKNSILSLPDDLMPLGRLGDIVSFYKKADKVNEMRDHKSLADLNELLKNYPALFTDLYSMTFYAKNKKDKTVIEYFDKFIQNLISLSQSDNEELANEAHSSLKSIFPHMSSYSATKFGLLFSTQSGLGKEWAQTLKD